MSLGIDVEATKERKETIAALVEQFSDNKKLHVVIDYVLGSVYKSNQYPSSGGISSVTAVFSVVEALIKAIEHSHFSVRDALEKKASGDDWRDPQINYQALYHEHYEGLDKGIGDLFPSVGEYISRADKVVGLSFFNLFQQASLLVGDDADLKEEIDRLRLGRLISVLTLCYLLKDLERSIAAIDLSQLEQDFVRVVEAMREDIKQEN